MPEQTHGPGRCQPMSELGPCHREIAEHHRVRGKLLNVIAIVVEVVVEEIEEVVEVEGKTWKLLYVVLFRDFVCPFCLFELLNKHGDDDDDDGNQLGDQWAVRCRM